MLVSITDTNTTIIDAFLSLNLDLFVCYVFTRQNFCLVIYGKVQTMFVYKSTAKPNTYAAHDNIN